MAERERGDDEDRSATDVAVDRPESAADETARQVRDVVGRRGYDEAEDEQATENEEH